MLELKFVQNQLHEATTGAYNRTMLELKWGIPGDKAKEFLTYNRTMLELKFETVPADTDPDTNL